MAPHFLLSAAARTLSLKAIYQDGEEAAYKAFRRIRWHETGGEPVCPRCGSLDAYAITTLHKAGSERHSGAKEAIRKTGGSPERPMPA
jgi:hypothetical protein